MYNNTDYINSFVSAINKEEKNLIKELVSNDNFDKMSRREQLDVFKKATKESM